jgi:hypothetical protein
MNFLLKGNVHMADLCNKLMLEKTNDIALYDNLIKTASEAKLATSNYISALIETANNAYEIDLKHLGKVLLSRLEHCDYVYPKLHNHDST